MNGDLHGSCENYIKKNLILLLLLNISNNYSSFVKCSVVAGLFEVDKTLEEAFGFAIESLNQEKSEEDPKINAVIQKDKPFAAYQETCQVLEKGTVAVFGPASYDNIDIVQSICDAKEIPHIITRWSIKELVDTENIKPYYSFLFFLV